MLMCVCVCLWARIHQCETNLSGRSNIKRVCLNLKIESIMFSDSWWDHTRYVLEVVNSLSASCVILLRIIFSPNKIEMFLCALVPVLGRYVETKLINGHCGETRSSRNSDDFGIKFTFPESRERQRDIDRERGVGTYDRPNYWNGLFLCAMFVQRIKLSGPTFILTVRTLICGYRKSK